MTFMENSGDIPMLGIHYCFDYGDRQCSQPDGSFQDANGKAAAPWGGPTVKFAKLSIAEAVKGTKENAECSNRGMCDYSTGLCKCFQGYTDFDCSIQHALGPPLRS